MTATIHARLKEDGGETTTIDLVHPADCDHLGTICPTCKVSWAIDWDFDPDAVVTVAPAPTPTHAWTTRFTVTLDRAGHVVVEQIDERGATIRAIDFGAWGGPAQLLLTWLEAERRDELAPAIDAYLSAEFAKRAL